MSATIHAKLAKGNEAHAFKALRLMDDFTTGMMLRGEGEEKPGGVSGEVFSPMISPEDFTSMCYSRSKSPDEILMEKEDELFNPDRIWDRKWDKFTTIKTTQS